MDFDKGKEVEAYCPWCKERVHLRTASSWGYYDVSKIECMNKKCPIQPSGKTKNNETWQQGKGTVEHHNETSEELIKEWKIYIGGN